MILKLPVLAADIANLTDARYFAAWYVDHMSFCMDQDADSYISPEQVKEIAGWVEGPTYLLQFRSKSTETAYVEWMMEATGVTGALSGQKLVLDTVADAEPVTLFAEVNDLAAIDQRVSGYIITKPEIDWRDLQKVTDAHIFLDYDLSLEEIKHLTTLERPPGIVVRGGVEEKVGYKSFDDLDQIYDLLLED